MIRRITLIITSWDKEGRDATGWHSGNTSHSRGKGRNGGGAVGTPATASVFVKQEHLAKAGYGDNLHR